MYADRGKEWRKGRDRRYLDRYRGPSYSEEMAVMHERKHEWHGGMVAFHCIRSTASPQ